MSSCTNHIKLLNNILNEYLPKYQSRQIKRNKQLYTYITNLYSFTSNINEMLYLYENNILELQKCELTICNNNTKFHSRKKGYHNTCSYRCSNLLRKENGTLISITNKSKQTCIEKYGADNPQKNKVIRDKTKTTNIKKYGVSCVMNQPHLIELRKDPVFKQKTYNAHVKAIQQKYGVDNVALIAEHGDKCKKTLLYNYGVDHYSKSEISIASREQKRFKIYDTMLETINIINIKNPSTEKILAYNNPNKIIQFSCSVCNNDDELTSETFKFRLRNFITACSTCLNINHCSSIAEREIGDFIKSNNINIERNNRTIIAPYELDIVIPEKKIAIEYCGLYWHSELKISHHKYHLEKMQRCDSVGYKLITIFEDEWIYHSNIVKEILLHKLGLDNRLIYEDKCIIKEINTSISRKFINENHIQGYDNSTIKLGAYYDSELVSVMTFSKSTLAKKNKIRQHTWWELSRFCSTSNIVGSMDKLFFYFVKHYSPLKIFTYVDLRWNTNNKYKNLGFTFISQTPINCWYIEGNKRIHRFKSRKNKNYQCITNHKKRIWDCGYLKLTWTKNDRLL